jgi:2',3'-cyclic-nucleotide 2'-phosphodiesterase (5'-nucleotidase family)
MMRRLLLLLLFLFAAPAWAKEAKLIFLHLNDVYEVTPINGQGGFAPLKTMLDRERKKAGTNGHATILSGDFLSPSAMSSVTKGTHMIALGNAIGIDIAVPGNHEFDFGVENFRLRIGESKFPWIVANLFEPDGKPFNNLAPTHVREMSGIKVGFFGLITPATKGLAGSVAMLGFEAVVPAAERAVKSLKEQGAEIIVALTHLNFDDDVALARSVPGIDLILGGHDHEPMSRLESGTLIHKSGQDARWLGIIELAAMRDEKGKLSIAHSWRVDAVRKLPNDKNIAALIGDYEKQLSTALDQPVGKSAVELDSRNETVRYRESSFGNLIADALRHVHKADAALVNGGGIRGNRVRPAGETLTRRDLIKELPFGNVGVLVEVEGAILREVLERTLNRAGKGSGSFPQISGMSLVYDIAKPPGSRLVSLEVAGAPLEEKRLYRLAASDFLVRGGDGQIGLKGAKVLIDPSAAQLITTEIEMYLQSASPYDPGLAPRIREVSEKR